MQSQLDGVQPQSEPSDIESRLRLMTCGSVDDGKSTLIGRLLYEAGAIFSDQLRAIERDSRKFGTQGERPDLALLVDGLQAEREQGITIDVAYRYFRTSRRRFIIADTPGHEQYTRNMATAASTSELALIIVDARKGILTQTLRHSRIVSMMGLHTVVLAVNKMDLVDYAEERFRTICADYQRMTENLGFRCIHALPLSALEGDNVFRQSVHMQWYVGPTLLSLLESIDVSGPSGSPSFRMPVQLVLRPNADFRGFAGRIVAGEVRAGDVVSILPAGRRSTVKEIVAWGGSLASAKAGQSITVTLCDEVDVSRGDVLVADGNAPGCADQFEARLLWLNDEPLLVGRPYLLKIHTKEVTATVTSIKYCEDVDTGAHLAARTMEANAIGGVTLSLREAVAFEPYDVDRVLGSFILIDRMNFQTLAAGMIRFALRRASNLRWQNLSVDKASRSAIKNQRARCIWFTGLSGAGKSTVANLLEKRLHADGQHTYLLDGDNIRHGLNRDLGFTVADRVENIRRAAEVAKLMVDAGLIVIVSFISPFRAERQLARSLFEAGEFIEVFVDTPLAECERRDPKGLYAKARAGTLKNFTGFDSAYEAPDAPEIHLPTIDRSPEECVDALLSRL